MRTHVYEYGLILGRFQPFHKGHEEIIQNALSMCDYLIIAIGSSTELRTELNPFSFIERKYMIENAFDSARIKIIAMPDDKTVKDSVYAERLYDTAKSTISDGKEIDIIFTSERGIEHFYPEKISDKTAFHIFPRRKSFISGTAVRNMLAGDTTLHEVRDAINHNNHCLLKHMGEIVKSIKKEA